MKQPGSHHVALSLIAVVALFSTASAQTPAQPAVQIRRAGFDRGTWPVDLNNDGRTDLVGAITAGTAPTVAVALGRGDGTFTELARTSVVAEPIGVGDFNGDGRRDVVVTGVAILPGNGNGTFGTPRPVTGAPAPPDEEATWYRPSRAVTADFNGDGRLDLTLLSGSSVYIHPGNGDFTFGPAMLVGGGDDTTANPMQAIAADFNGDGRRDLAVAYLINAIDIFINNGGLLFTPSRIAVTSANFWDITAGDLNGDNRVDLVAAASFEGGFEWSDGKIVRLLGNGNGTFQAPVEYQTGAIGSMTSVVGDFNRDGHLDVATGNRSRVYRDYACAPPYHYWDSVSILRGRGDGSFASPRRFHVDYFTGDDPTFRNTHNALNTSDVNADGHTDLIFAPRTLLLNAPPAANRAPAIFGGPDRMVDPIHFVRLESEVSDADYDAVSVVWRDSAGQLLGDTPVICQQFFESTTVTVTVTDSLGATASDRVEVFVPEGDVPYLMVTEPDAGETVSTSGPFVIQWDANSEVPFTAFDVSSSADDGNTWTAVPGCSNVPGSARQCRWNAPGPVTDRARIRVVARNGSTMRALAVSDRFRVVSGPSTSLPDGWFNLDVGAVGAAGSAAYNSSTGTFTVRGSGADIWNTADEFHFAYTVFDGDFDFVARVTGVQNVNQWTKAGLMIRRHLGASSPYAAVFATPGTAKGVSVQARTTEAEMSAELSRRPLAPPIWLKLMRRGSAMYFAYRQATTDPWVLQRIVGTHQLGSLAVGLAVSSHVDGTLATATFDNVSVVRAPEWENQDIGAVGLAGSVASGEEHRTTIDGSGADIWGTADAFHYRFTHWSGDGTITARVLSIEHQHRWSKAGVMFRESTAAGSKHVMAIVSAARGLAMQYRSATNGVSADAGLRAGTAPEWVRLTRSGNVFTAFSSNDGVTWTQLGSVTVAMGPDILLGLPVTSHNNDALATAVFDDVSVRR